MKLAEQNALYDNSCRKGTFQSRVLVPLSALQVFVRWSTAGEKVGSVKNVFMVLVVGRVFLFLSDRF